MKFALLPAVLALAPPAFTPLPTGATTPKGWLLKQLTLQAEGLSGHLSQFWHAFERPKLVGRVPREPTVFMGRMPREPSGLRGRVPRKPTVFRGRAT